MNDTEATADKNASVKRKIRADHQHAGGSHKLEFTVIIGSSLLLLLYWLGWATELFGVNTALLAALLGGMPIIFEALRAIYQRGDTKVGLLVSIAILSSIAIGEYFAAAEVALIMTIGEMLEHITLEKSNTALKKLAELTPLQARLIENGNSREITAEMVNPGDRLLIKPGEKIPVDGVVAEGYAAVNQAMITGEALPVECRSGVEVFGGTIVIAGSIEMVATKVGQDTALGHIIKMVEEAQSSKAPTARIIDRWAGWFVPLSLSIACLVYLVTGDIVRAVTILIVFCPCAMLLSTPTAVAAAIGAAARRGILIKGGDILERTGKLDIVIMDKTGTLTQGKPYVKEIYCGQDWKENDLLALAAGMERRSEHHLARAIIEEAVRQNVSPIDPDSWKAVIGQGIVAQAGDRQLLLGNEQLLGAQGVEISDGQKAYSNRQQELGATVVFLAADGAVAGVIAIHDPLRNDAAKTVQTLYSVGIKQVVLLTGDTAAAGEAVARQAGIRSVFGGLLPGDKAKYIEGCQLDGARVAMTGDGINDAPALARADIGIAMGYCGTDIAIEAADIVLLSDDLKRVPETIEISRKAIRTIWQNLAAANSINFIAIIFAAVGLLGPVAAAIVHNIGSIAVVLNSARLLRGAGNGKSEALVRTGQFV